MPLRHLRGSPSRPGRRLATLGIVAAILLSTAGLVEFAGPYLLLKTGLGTGYEVGNLRRGTAEYSKRFNLTDQARSRRVGIALARRGESLRIRWDAEVREGAPSIALRPFPGSGDPPLWRESLDLRPAGDTSLTVGGTGLYQIRMSRTRWAGSARVRWRVEATRDVD